MGAGDTFRAAAVDQLKIWSERAGCQFFSKGMNVDPAAVAYETVDYAIHNQCDMAIIDTAGRLHTKINLMSELGKIKRSIAKRMEGAPHEVLLVLDATTGQNAIEQAKHFSEATDVTAIALTKLDGTAKGGIVIAISDMFKIPIKYIGVGEGMDKLQIFNKRRLWKVCLSSKHSTPLYYVKKITGKKTIRLSLDANIRHFMETWIIYALLSMLFAGLTSILAKYGLQNIHPDLGLGIRTTTIFS